MPKNKLFFSLSIFASLFLNISEGKPNIIFLLADDQATISMGCYGNEDAVTPNLDRLSQRGLTFDNHYVTTAICMASRASILTGKKDKNEFINAAKNGNDIEDLKKMRDIYDQEINSLKKQSAPSHQIYGSLFDRAIPWFKKRQLLPAIIKK